MSRGAPENMPSRVRHFGGIKNTPSFRTFVTFARRENINSAQNMSDVQLFLARAFGARVYRASICQEVRTRGCLCVCVILQKFQTTSRFCLFGKPCIPKRQKFPLKMCQVFNFFRSRLRRSRIPRFMLPGACAKNAFSCASFWGDFSFWRGLKTARLRFCETLLPNKT